MHAGPVDQLISLVLQRVHVLMFMSKDDIAVRGPRTGKSLEPSSDLKVTNSSLGEVHAGYLLALKRGEPPKSEYSNGALALGSMFVHVQYGPKRQQIKQ